MRGVFNPDYFDTIGIRLQSGRNFTPNELSEKKPVIIINQSLAKRLWPNESPLGQHVRSVAEQGWCPRDRL